MDTNINSLHPSNVPPININNISSSSQEKLPQRHINRHLLNNHYNNNKLEIIYTRRNRNESQVDSLSSSVSQTYPNYTSRNGDIEIESNLSNSLTSTSSFIGEDELYAKFYHQHESLSYEHSSSVGSRSGIGTNISRTNHRSRYPSISNSSNNQASSNKIVTSSERVVIPTQKKQSNSLSIKTNTIRNYSSSYETSTSGSSIRHKNRTSTSKYSPFNSSIDINRSNIIEDATAKSEVESDLIYNQSKKEYKEYYNKKEDLDSDSTEIEDIIVRSSGFVDYTELSESEFDQMYIEANY